MGFIQKVKFYKVLHVPNLKFICTKITFYFLGERELVEFLTEEILVERKAQKNKSIPTELDGFKVSLDGSEMTLIKKTDKESCVVF